MTFRSIIRYVSITSVYKYNTIFYLYEIIFHIIPQVYEIVNHRRVRPLFVYTLPLFIED